MRIFCLILAVLHLLSPAYAFIAAVWHENYVHNNHDSYALTDRLDLIDKVHPYRDVNLGRNLTIHSAFSGNLGQKALYKFRKPVGKGTFSQVFKAVHIPTGDRVAVKFLVHSQEEKISKEIQILRELKDAPNFLPLRDILKDEYEDGEVEFAMIFDYFPTEDWKIYLLDVTRYQMKKMVYETLRTLEYAHSKGIMHRDIKPLNVLMNPKKLEVRVIDWGLSDYYHPDKESNARIGTVAFKAPELILNYTKHDYSVDIWATGTMLAGIAFKRTNFFGRVRSVELESDSNFPSDERLIVHLNQLELIVRTLGTKGLKEYANSFQDSMNLGYLKYIGDYEKQSLTDFINEENAHMIEPSLIDLLEKMFFYDHRMRITAKEALEHPYFDEVRVRNVDA